MKMNQTVRFSRSTISQKTATIAFFGTGRLVKKGNGRHELIGGTADDCTAAREWCSLFAHEVVFTSDARPARTQWPDCQRSSHRQALSA